MTRLVGILNVTPDSFSDGGLYATPKAACARAETLLQAGADVLDIGAESTRPGATPLKPEEEWARLEPVLATIMRLSHAAGASVSVDTRHAETATRVLALGVDWVNDVSGAASPSLCQALLSYPRARYVLMHSLSVPADPDRTLPRDQDPIREVAAFLEARLAQLEAWGLARQRVILDPGIGFGKSAAHSLRLLWRSPELARRFGLPLLVGHARKSCFALADDAGRSHREALTLLASSYLIDQQTAYLRVHDVGAHATLRKTLRPT